MNAPEYTIHECADGLAIQAPDGTLITFDEGQLADDLGDLIELVEAAHDMGDLGHVAWADLRGQIMEREAHAD